MEPAELEATPRLAVHSAAIVAAARPHHPQRVTIAPTYAGRRQKRGCLHVRSQIPNTEIGEPRRAWPLQAGHAQSTRHMTIM